MRKGQKHTLETLKKMRDSHLGYKMPYSQKLKISLANKGGNKTSFKKGMKPWNKDKIMPDSFGENHPLWKGKNVGYVGLHNWVRLKLGKINKCDICGSINEKKYEWANVSGEYKRNLKDWIRLCVRCHKKFDGISKPIIQLDKNGLIIKKYDSVISVSKDGFDPRHVSKCCKNIKNYKTSKGFIWKYEN